MSTAEERLARVESRLVQLMYALGLDPHGKNRKGVFLGRLAAVQSAPTTDLDHPTYLRQGGERLTTKQEK